ncbi:hypothetical protein GF385_03065, partial [Candidatus Dependentiae bacterium]|nr:hypothetical protein [Candidatus Dependentiae bacterium]
MFKYKKLLILFLFLINVYSFGFYNNKINLDSMPFYSFLNRFEEGKDSFRIIKLLEDIIYSINEKKFYYNPKIKTEIIGILNSLDNA